MTSAWFYAIRNQRLRQGLCPGCGGKITQGYGLMDGHIGVYEVCLGRDCLDPYREIWPDPELEEHAPEAGRTTAGTSANVTARSSSSQ